MVKKFFGLSGQALNWAIGAVAGCDFLLFGYGRRSVFPFPFSVRPVRLSRGNSYRAVRLCDIVSTVLIVIFRPRCYGWHSHTSHLP